MSTATLAHAVADAQRAASHVRSTPPMPKTTRRVIQRFPAGEPRGSWPAEEFAQGLRRNGRVVDVVMDLATDSYLVIEGGERS
jgi:hypothetical protein